MASRVQGNDSDSEVTTPCDFHAIGKDCNTSLMSNSSKANFAMLQSSVGLSPPQSLTMYVL